MGKDDQNKQSALSPSAAVAGYAPDDTIRLTWLIATGNYGLIDHDAYGFDEDLQSTVRQRIDEFMQAYNAKAEPQKPVRKD